MILDKFNTTPTVMSKYAYAIFLEATQIASSQFLAPRECPLNMTFHWNLVMVPQRNLVMIRLTTS